MAEKALSIFLGVLISAWFLGDLAIWLFPLKGHPWRRKVLLQLLFLLPVFLYIAIFLLWKPFEKAEPTFREFYLSYAMLVLFFTGMLSAFLWLSSSGGIFFWTFYFYLRLYFKGVSPIKEELWREIDKQIEKSAEFFKSKRRRLVNFLSLTFLILVNLWIIAQLTYDCFFRIHIPHNAALHPKVSGDDKYLGFILLNFNKEPKETLMISSLPDRRVVYKSSYNYKQTEIKPLGWRGDSLLAKIENSGETGLLVLRKEGEEFKSTYEKLPPYEDLYLIGSHLYAIKEEKRQIVRLGRKDGKWFEESVFPLERELPGKKEEGWAYDRYYHFWEINNKPAVVLAEARWKKGEVHQAGEANLRKAYFRLGIIVPGERAKLLREFEVYVGAIGWRGGFSESKDRCYFYLQLIDSRTGRYLPRFLLFEITPNDVKERELKWDLEKFAGEYEMCATRNGYLLFYRIFPRFIERGKPYLLFYSPSGEKKAIEWKYDEIGDVVSLNNEDKVLLFNDKGIFLVDNLSCSVKKICRFP
jgi:hypothetical protein